MTSIPPHIAGALFSTQIIAKQLSKEDQARRAKRHTDSRALAQLADQQEHEVENTDQTEHARVHRNGEQSQHPDQQGDTFERELHNAEQSIEKPTDDIGQTAKPGPVPISPTIIGPATRESVTISSSAPESPTVESATESTTEPNTESTASEPTPNTPPADLPPAPDDNNPEEPHHIDLNA